MTNYPSDKARISLAKKTARKLLKDAGINKPPILLRHVVKHLKKTKNLYVLSWSFGDNIDGIQVTEGTDITIGYNPSFHQHRQRFTVAHEIGHMLLGHTSVTSQFNLTSKKIEELEANQFAAELLMPLPIFKIDFALNKRNVRALADLYNVSLEATWWRIYDCKLF
jgi:Zn-dependent peptidase ImmA (M78 family)